MKDIPETIFLQIDEYGKDAESFSELETTFCEDKIYEDDIEYILKSKYDELEQQKAELLEFIQHLYINYHLPYGGMDIETKKKFEEIRKKYK